MLLLTEQLDKLAELDPEVVEFLAKHPMPPPDHSSHIPLRQMMSAMTKIGLEQLGPTPSHLTETYHSIPMRDGYLSRIKVTHPSDLTTPGPLFVLFFGGAFIGGELDQLTEIARATATLYSATVILPSYRLAPEHPFPISQYDAIDTIQHLATHSSSPTSPLFPSNPSKAFILGGVSAGAALAASLTRYFPESSTPPLPHKITGQWLCVPALMDDSCVPAEYAAHYRARRTVLDAPALSAGSLALSKRLVKYDPASPLRYAVNATSELGLQPRTYLQVDGADPLRDDGLVYGEMLERAGVEVKVDLYAGCPHAHMTWMRGTEVGDRGMVDLVAGLGWLLGSEVGREEVVKVLGYGK